MTAPRICLLRNWQEVGQAYLDLMRCKLYVVTWPNKQWDIWQFYSDLQGVDRSWAALDVGCGGNSTLRLLWKMGFQSIQGVDLHLSLADRLRHLEDIIKNWISPARAQSLPYRICQRDYLTIHPKKPFGVLTALSVVEHGVIADQFFTKASELLHPDGILCLTTDYWPTLIETSVVLHNETFNLPWQIFDRAKLTEWIDTAQRCGFRVPPSSDIEETFGLEPCVTSHWLGFNYTSIYVSFVRA